MFKYILGQFFSVHIFSPVALPIHEEPLKAGTGLSHDLDRDATPSSHVTEHAPQSLQLPHPPSTANNRNNVIKVIFKV